MNYSCSGKQGGHFVSTYVASIWHTLGLPSVLGTINQIQSNSLFSQFYIGKQHEKYIHKFVKHLIVVLNMKFV